MVIPSAGRSPPSRPDRTTWACGRSRSYAASRLPAFRNACSGVGRNDLRPQAEGGPQGALVRDAVEGGDAAVVAVVVGDVRAGAQQLQQRPGQFGRLGEDLGDRVEPGAAARAEHDLLQVGEAPGPVEGHGQREETAQPGRHPLVRGVGHLALVPGDADQAQRVHARDGVGQFEALGVGTDTGPRALARGQFDHHVQRAGGARLAQGGVHQLDAAQRVDVADAAEAGVGVQFGGEPAQRDGVDDLVGEEDPLDAVGAVDAGLVGDGGGDAPGAAGQLAGEELRGHRGLAVRGEGQAVPLGVALQQREVVLQRFGGQGEDGGGEAAGEQVPPLRRELADGTAVRVRGKPLEAVVDAFVREGLRVPGGGGCVGAGRGTGGAAVGVGRGGHGASSRSCCTVCNTHCAYRLQLSNIRAIAGSMVRNTSRNGSTSPYAKECRRS
ncbi:hypothetical protein SRIMM317S_00381 [Streptomyces rimosus subsp. rimosus]